MALRLRFLLDTNILIPLQDSMVVLQPSLTNFVRLCNSHGHQLLYHPASVADIRRDSNEDRRNRTLARLGQYTQLQAGPACPWNTPQTSVNDACDNEILYALENDAAHALVTEDQGLHRKARERGLSSRVYFIQTANDWLCRLHEPGDVLLPNIDDVEIHTLTHQLAEPFFDSIRAGYDGFNDWFRRKAMEGRRAWVYRDGAEQAIAAICIYAVQTDEVVTDSGEVLAGDSLKLCTFKVGEAVRGRKVGELFLRAAFKYATSHQCESVFLHANNGQQTQLTTLIEDFGFRNLGVYRGDAVYVKAHPINPPALLMDPFQYVQRFYPHYLSGDDVQKFLVPIQPQFHDVLFPDYQAPGHALPDDHPQRHVGNAIKLAYLCRTPNKQPRAGDVVLFYRSRDMRALTTLGVVESYEWSGSADKIARIVSRRTVYSDLQIEEMAQAETKVMLFRLICHFEPPLEYATLKRLRIVKGPIQSITKISDESFSRILRATER
ncbi:GNAT family N-acetyltransferase [Pseudomonas sp. St29]|uniref:GNAT family N-acetyltransferase n=1 Tax=Pseudomonas sp. St29 TaxID=1500687 RepID=UPI0018E0821B|nr:GNAT family N-acetyltransferase [Pseudomonas sp. St29]